MGRTVAVIWHASFSIVAAGLYFFFVIPRWPELMGQTSPTVGLVLRIVTGVLIGLAALPVVFTLQRTQRPEFGTPQLALRLRSWSIVLHVLAGLLIVGTAISEIWLSLDTAGQWLFGIYGAAAAMALLGVFGFYLAFVAELPPPPPKPLKVREAGKRRGRGKTDEKTEAEDEPADEADKDEAEKSEADEVEDTTDADETEKKPAEVTAEETDTPAEKTAETADDTAEDDGTDESSASDEDKNSNGKLRNRRPSNKGGNSRLRWRSRGGVAVED
ncbi:hypothetical protein [Mycolicibacterium wolinskyi]|uniref:hypothetical protein n=1 Tax=Mycolicibacterium wolinskyi TaxID=59750 RepID=UPI003917AF1C